MRRITVVIVVSILAAGCAAQQGASVQTDVAKAEVALTAAERVALHYVTLPPCLKAHAPLCSDAAVVARIKQADNAAYAAVKAARASNNRSDLTAANAAVAALSALVPPAAGN